MKYRLKKDLPDMEAGEIFDDTDSFGHETSSMLDSRGTYRFEKDDIKHFDEWFDPVTDEWPQIDECYYRVSSEGSVVCSLWEEDLFDRNCQAIGNVFKTREAAEQFAKYLKAITTVRQDEGVLTPEQVDELIKDEGLAYCVGYMINRDNEKVSCGCPMSFDDYWMPVGAILFDSDAHADSSLRKHPDEWKIIVNYDWSRE